MPLALLAPASRAVDVPLAVLLLLPLGGLLALASRGRSARIAEAQRRLELVAHERMRLQRAVRRLGEALVAKLDLAALTDIVLRGSIEALDADAGLLTLDGPDAPLVLDIHSTPEDLPALHAVAGRAEIAAEHCQIERNGVWALAEPFGFSSESGPVLGAVAVARRGRPFREDERAVMGQLVARARQAAADSVANQLLREQAVTDSLTGLGNRRMLAADLHERVAAASPSQPLVLAVLDLDGFKHYNDTFGHPAGDALLMRLARKLAGSVAPLGSAYRLGGDEFCVLLSAPDADIDAVVAAAAAALEEHGENFSIGTSFGAVLLPQEAIALEQALQVADERMYAVKKRRQSSARDQTRDVLMRIIQARQPALEVHCSEVAELCLRVGRRLGMAGEGLDELARAAHLHDIGKVGIPDAILRKPGPLDATEWEFMRRHTVLGERILSAAPALRPVASIVGATQERWDGCGYPGGLAGSEIPLAARIIAACDAYVTMTGERAYGVVRDRAAACAELRREARHRFDPLVVEVLLQEVCAGAPSPVTGVRSADLP